MRPLRVALAQLNPTVGAFEENANRIVSAMEQAAARGADLVVVPELAVCGYPPEDLLLRSDFLEANRRAVDDIASRARQVTAVVGFADRQEDVFNAAAILSGGKVAGIYHKHHLPNYAVFDEKRYFQSGRRPVIFTVAGVAVGVTICEDMWYPDGPHVLQAAEGAEILLCSSASPYHRGKSRDRERMLATRAADTVSVVAFCNLVGGQDELVFDGGSVVFDEQGRMRARGRAFEEDLVLCDVDADSVFRSRLHDPRRRDVTPVQAELKRLFLPVERLDLGARQRARTGPSLPASIASELEPMQEVRKALVLGIRDYVEKNRFDVVVLGISGGIDSALTAVLAVEALGVERVVGVFLPSKVTERQSGVDAEDLARRLGIRLLTVPIEPIVDAYRGALQEVFRNVGEDVTEENLQARARGNLLMALSNKFGWMVLTTGNKSEFSVGYCTIYGDMAGGFSVLKDVSKSQVYALAKHLNAAAVREGKEPPIPEPSISRPPTAELRPGQKDEDTLPPYAALDPILAAYVEQGIGPGELVSRGFLPEMVFRILGLVDGNEYKRRQAPPGIRITPRAFGRDRRMPITNRYRAAARDAGEAARAAPEGRRRTGDASARSKTASRKP